MKKLIFGSMVVFCGILNANAAMVQILPTIPSSWLLQNYIPGTTVLWFTGSACANGQLTLPASATTNDHSRLYATIMSAKASNTKVFVYYDNAVTGCPISSFGVQ